MSKSVKELGEEARAQHNTEANTFEMFPVGTAVEVISPCVDFYFWYNERGQVIENKGCYLGIIVRFDEPIIYEGGYRQETFNFNPTDLIVIPAQQR